jgi:hypothetical protein
LLNYDNITGHNRTIELLGSPRLAVLAAPAVGRFASDPFWCNYPRGVVNAVPMPCSDRLSRPTMPPISSLS